MKATSSITITDADVERLATVVATYSAKDDDAASALQAELDRAEIVASAKVPPVVVTMNSRVVLRDEAGNTREVTLVYPWEADADAGKISVLAPLGRALLGARVGDRVDVFTQRGGRAWVVESIPYQPEAAGAQGP